MKVFIYITTLMQQGEASESVELKTIDIIERRFLVTKDIKDR